MPPDSMALDRQSTQRYVTYLPQKRRQLYTRSSVTLRLFLMEL